MGERKVLNKYFPPDFDPSKLPQGKQSKNQQKTIRNMLSMSIRCKTCGNYMSRGTKFNTPKEIASGETYLGIKIIRFYFKCSNCSTEFTIKTDPRNLDHVVEWGVTRNYDSRWEETGNATMRSLENRMQDTRREMKRDAAIDELISMGSRRAKVSADVVLEALQRQAAEEKKQHAAEDKAIAASIFRKGRDFVARIPDEDIENEGGDGYSHQLPNRSGETRTCNIKRRRVLKDMWNPTDYLIEVSHSDSSNNANSNEQKSIFKSSSGTVSVMIRNKSPTKSIGKDQVRREESNQVGESKVEDKTTRSTGLQSIQNYESDDESS